MASKVQIISDAFVNLGKGVVSSPETDNPIFAAASSVYDRLLPSMLTIHPWRFAMKSFQLNKLNESSPYARWSAVFQIPGDVELIYRTDPLLNYEIFQNKLFTNSSSVLLEYLFLPKESEFPAYFTQLMIVKLTARIAMTVTQLDNLAAFWEKESIQQIALARAADSSMMPNIPVVRNAIYQSHFQNSRRF